MSTARASGRLDGVGVLLTRARHQATALVTRLEEMGAQVHAHPVIEIVPPQDAAPLREAMAHLHTHDWIVFSSANAVQACLLAGGGAWPAGRCRVAAVGKATAHALEEHGIAVDLLPRESTAEGLAQALVERHDGHLDGLVVLFPRAREGRDALPRILGQGGAHVILVEAYRTVPCTEQQETLRSCLREGSIQVLTFASPSAVRAFDQMAGDVATRSLPTVCIGPTTAQAAMALGYRVSAVPPEPTTDGMARAIQSCLDSRKEHAVD